jgi:hypothetical protein
MQPGEICTAKLLSAQEAHVAVVVLNVRFQIVGSCELGLTKVAFVCEFFCVQRHVFDKVAFFEEFLAAVCAFQLPGCVRPGMHLEAVFSPKHFWAQLTLQRFSQITADY